MRISVIVCSNRPHRLTTMLESACALAVPAGLDWELLVVDNGGGAVAAAARPFAARLPLRIVEEPEPGLSLARNRGVREAKGDYLCWTDDDVLLDPSWLAAYAEAFARHPEAALFGGRILPRPEEGGPAWFRRNHLEWPLAYFVAHRDMGDEESPVTLEGGRLPWGANFAVRAAEQRRHPYDPRLGFSPHHNRSGEETDVICRILVEGGAGWWVPDSKVEHIVAAERQSLAALSAYYEQAGRTVAFHRDLFARAAARSALGPLPFARASRPALLLAAAAARAVSVVAALLGLTGPRLRFLARSSYYRGIAAHLDEARRKARSVPRPLETGKAFR